MAYQAVPQRCSAPHIIAQGLSPLRMERALVEAERILISRLRALAAKHTDFAFETTIAGRSHAAFLLQLKRAGYRIELYYLWIPSADFSARRVAMRVERDGHDVPLPVIRRRFCKSLTIWSRPICHWLITPVLSTIRN